MREGTGAGETHMAPQAASRVSSQCRDASLEPSGAEARRNRPATGIRPAVCLRRTAGAA